MATISGSAWSAGKKQLIGVCFPLCVPANSISIGNSFLVFDFFDLIASIGPSFRTFGPDSDITFVLFITLAFLL